VTHKTAITIEKAAYYFDLLYMLELKAMENILKLRGENVNKCDS
tara:strand:- start:10 stop:141 length:132 start_codon:yes stop_codon:yes gene_type:complete